MFKQTSSLRSSASVVDGNLIISLPDAIDPIVWRMALGEARAAALEVRAQADHYILVLKYPKGDSIEIAPFNQKQTATNALMAVARAMQNAHGDITPAHKRTAGGQTSSVKWLIPLGLIVLAIFIFSRAADFLPAGSVGPVETSASTSAGQSSGETGVAVSADSYLNGM